MFNLCIDLIPNKKNKIFEFYKENKQAILLLSIGS